MAPVELTEKRRHGADTAPAFSPSARLLKIKAFAKVPVMKASALRALDLCPRESAADGAARLQLLVRHHLDVLQGSGSDSFQ
ncbi:MAG: hypothetical protein LH491_09240 [Pseudoxanthomonas sp.]|nr:hypothetical protein [Pseudoxanthomonas sp.]